MNKLAIVTTHPIQYYAPIFKLLAAKCNLMVFYTWGETAQNERLDQEFKKVFKWDIPLLDGYPYLFLENVAKDKGSHHFKGINNPTIINEIKNFNPDALLVYGWAYQSHLKVLRHFKGKIQVWFRGDSTNLNTNGWLKALIRKTFLKWVYQHVDIAFYVGSANKAYYEKLGLTNQKLIFAPHAIDNHRFAALPSKGYTDLRKTLNLTTKDILVLFAGKLDHKKNPSLLLKAFEDIDMPNAHLLFVGNGSLEEELKDRVKNEMIKNVHFISFQNQSQMPIIYQACDVYCLPSVSETWGLAVNEAMAAKKAILVSNKVGCAVDLVKNGENGFIFKSADLADLKEKLLVLLKNKQLTAEMGVISSKIIENWTMQQQADTIIKTLNLS
eukprot:GDKJ01008764.1.p3 GENE.GDKJ01008764.1~~GDKJ01008764.1.p3  ORF type:complete len:384 (-),score=27.65 GDKJ01008764.1:3442-4593(-)